jgi:hypothetical protein
MAVTSIVKCKRVLILSSPLHVLFRSGLLLLKSCILVDVFGLGTVCLHWSTIGLFDINSIIVSQHNQRH